VLELETLGPLSVIQEWDGVEHVERWTCARTSAFTSFTGDELDEVVGPLL
jgi:hypothetical protein